MSYGSYKTKFYFWQIACSAMLFKNMLIIIYCDMIMPPAEALQSYSAFNLCKLLFA